MHDREHLPYSQKHGAESREQVAKVRRRAVVAICGIWKLTFAVIEDLSDPLSGAQANNVH